MTRFMDPRYFHIFIDSNIADELKHGVSPATRKLVQYINEGHFHILIPHSVRVELKNQNTPISTTTVADENIFTIPTEETSHERRRCDDFISEVRGDAQPQNIDPDLRHIWEVEKYGGGYSITLDKRLLKRAPKIAPLIQVDILTPDKFVHIFENVISANCHRDLS